MKRSSDYHSIPDLAQLFSKEQSIGIFEKMCLCRYFELEVANAYEKSLIASPIYLSIGQESISAALSTVISNFTIFAQHRCHSAYLAFGGDQHKIVDELLGRPTGCAFGQGGSPMLQDPDIPMIGHHGLIGENIPLAVGYALGSTQPTLCLFGDAAAEEDYALTAMGFASKHQLPVLFVCEDNDLSILTPTEVRRNWEICDVAQALNMPAVDITDDPWLIAHHAQELIQSLPAFINCRTCRHYWHAGVGIDHEPEWDRLQLVKDQLKTLSINAQDIEEQTKQDIKGLWEKLLPKQLKI
ncbi:MAG: hypothetical protein K8S27_10140 [Candidatus Omnitrophica bacterium]|nr:hypothetical protein [Candidatus Omnitrophota bacterium]